jgi:two-component system, cell cycle sensor histidine kinase PleC
MNGPAAYPFQSDHAWLDFAEAAEAFVLLDAGRRLLLWNESYRQLWNLPADLPRRTPYAEMLAHLPDAAEIVALLDRPDVPLEHQIAGGRWLSSRVRPGRDGGFVIVHVDISALKQREAELTRAYDQLELQNRRIEEAAHDLAEARDAAQRANEAKSVFLANMSHELRTPLNAIIGFSEIIEREMFGPLGSQRYRDYLGDIGRSGRHLLTLINDILDMSKIEARKMELHEQEIEVADLIAECVRVLATRAATGRVTVDTEVAPDLPHLYADATRMRQVLINLLSNAVKFTDPEGRVAVRASLDAAGHLAIGVKDSGRGMSGEDIEVALQPFRQVATGYARPQEGTGLGLPLAKALVGLHGGDLEIRSQPGSGTTVTVLIPPTRLMFPKADRASA